MAIFGKAIGNGYAINAIIGKKEIMLKADNTFLSSTFWSERIGPTAALATLEEMKKTITKMQSKKRIDVTCQIITCISEDSEIAILRAKKTLAFYISVGNIYREFLSKNGFQNETNNIFDEFKKSDNKRFRHNY